jgi:hypothetical protein
MRKLLLFLSVLFTTTLFSQRAEINSQKTELGGVTVYWSLPTTLTVYEGTMLTINANTSMSASMNWSLSGKSAYFMTASSPGYTTTSTATINFTKPGVYYVSIFATNFNGFGGNYGTVIVLPKSTKQTFFNQ